MLKYLYICIFIYIYINIYIKYIYKELRLGVKNVIIPTDVLVHMSADDLATEEQRSKVYIYTIYSYESIYL